MKTLILTLTLLTSLFAFEPDWITDYEIGLAEAEKEHKDVYLFIAADACPFCKKFKNETLSKVKIMMAIEKDFVPIYLSRDHHYIPDQFERYGAPRHYFLKENGEVYNEDAGFKSPTQFLELLKESALYRED